MELLELTWFFESRLSKEWEVWVKHSTWDGETAAPNSFFRTYLDGVLVMSIEEMNTTLCLP
jgi:hypothetical protein